MLPKKTTPIKNEILVDIFAKGLLSKEEMRIIFYIIRWSWGFDGVKRRQDWTKKITRKKIADDIEMNKSHLSININKMIEENIIIIKNNCYQFNEHYEDWKRLPKRKLYREVAEKETKVAEKETSADLKPLQDKPLPDRKETLKCTFKENIKKRGDIFINTWKEFKEMRKVKGKKMSIGSEKRILEDLDKLSNNVEEQIAILDQSIKYSWTGVFPLKKDKKDDDDHMPDLDELTKDKKYRDYFNMPDLDKLKREGKI